MPTSVAMWYFVYSDLVRLVVVNSIVVTVDVYELRMLMTIQLM